MTELVWLLLTNLRLLCEEMYLRHRAQLAQGKVINDNGGFLKPASSMFKLNWDCKLENMAYEYASKCSLRPSDPASRPGIGENIFAAVNRYMNHTSIAELRYTLKLVRWISAVMLYTIGFTLCYAAMP
ncbi:hypothetical protein ANCCEY_07314 [Ancylostoma ceylanicum]|uniref:SCP domain-containing protein n=1 Tax=Ancylostoma ceylanicum TaxID=53326 RepID=A0A0D6M123_9BILA|nr:hypothetical protein ANCCEY_07314 [Ancylostoma ceylanicum]